MPKETLGDYIGSIIVDHDMSEAILLCGFNALIEYPRFRTVISRQISERINSVDVNDVQFLGALMLLKSLEKSLGEKAKFSTDPLKPIPEETAAFNIIRNAFEAHTLQQSGRDIDSFLRSNEELIKHELPRLTWPF